MSESDKIKEALKGMDTFKTNMVIYIKPDKKSGSNLVLFHGMDEVPSISDDGTSVIVKKCTMQNGADIDINIADIGMIFEHDPFVLGPCCPGAVWYRRLGITDWNQPQYPDVTVRIMNWADESVTTHTFSDMSIDVIFLKYMNFLKQEKIMLLQGYNDPSSKRIQCMVHTDKATWMKLIEFHTEV